MPLPNSGKVSPPRSATVVITVADEAHLLHAKLHNLLGETCWGAHKVDLILVVDGCDLPLSEAEHELLRQIPHTIIRTPTPLGKNACQQIGVNHARGDIVIFNDIGTKLSAGAGIALIEAFASEHVGCASGVDHPEGCGIGECLYVSGEMHLRSLESRAGGLVVASGCLFAARSNHAKQWNGVGTSDFAIPLIVARCAQQTVAVPLATCSYLTQTRGVDEFRRKRRTIVHGLEVLHRHRDLLAVWRYGFISVKLFGHKFLRWLAAPAALLLAGSGVVLTSVHTVFVAPAFALTATVAVGSIGMIRRDDEAQPAVVGWCTYATLVFAATLAAWWDVFNGNSHTRWPPSNSTRHSTTSARRSAVESSKRVPSR